MIVAWHKISCDLVCVICSQILNLETSWMNKASVCVHTVIWLLWIIRLKQHFDYMLCSDPQVEPWLTPSCPGAVRPTSTWQRGGRWTGTRDTTCSWWPPTRSDTPWGWSTPRCDTLWCPRTTGSSDAIWCRAGTTSSPCSSCTVSGRCF